MAGVNLVERIYLDTNVYCRPLDDHGGRRVQLESQAFTEIADIASRGEITIVSSDYVKFEIEQIPDPLRRKDIKGFERTLSLANITSSRRLTALSKTFSAKCVLNSLDALHVSAACIGNAHFLLTCDDEVLNKGACIERLACQEGYRLKVRNPVNYVRGRQR